MKQILNLEMILYIIIINKLSLNEQDNAILDLKSLNREETIEKLNKFKNKKEKTIY